MIGKILNERYEITSELGHGGMGTVYRAHDESLNRDVAVKLMSNTKLGTEGRARLMGEAQTIAQLNHPNIVTVFDVGQFESLPYIVMEVVEGNTLREAMPKDWEDILTVAKQITAALLHAHDHEIIHRDLKPENVVIESDGTVKLMDFGIAQSVSSHITSEGMVIGTVYYMSPEQAMGKSVDVRSDLYSLGVMLYEFSTGDVPFQDIDPIAVISQHINAPLVPIRAKSEDIPPGLETLITRLLEKEPEERPVSAEEVLKELNDPLFLDTGAYPVQELSLLDRIISGRMVGRRVEFKSAQALWAKAVAGQGKLLLISGEPGIGKTRLTRETSTHVEVDGGRALTGACYAEGNAPYSAFGQIIREVFANGEKPTIELPEYVMADLLTIAPDLQPRFPEILPNPQLEAKLEQQRIFENISTFFRLLSSELPLLVVIEDVHWADSGTLLLLLHLSRNVQKDPILLLANYREVELDKGNPLQQILLDINREHLAQRIKLARLDRQQTSEMLTSLFNEDTTPKFLEGIFLETEGNPYFIEEVCKALVESGKLYYEDGVWHRPDIEELEIPQSIRIAIQARVGKLAEKHQNILLLAAVFGHEFDFENISRASDQDEDSIIDALEAAEKAQLIRANTQAGAGAFSFMHALVPSTIYESTNSLRRMRLHKSAAEAIQSLHPEDYEQLAYHFTGAGDLDNAIKNYRLAAQRAQEVFALDAAIKDLQSALDLIEPREHIQMRIEILENMADLQHKLGDNIRSISVYQEALNLWEGDGSKDKLIAAHIYRNIIVISGASTSFDDFRQFEDIYQSVINASTNLVDLLPPDPVTVYLLMALSQHFWYRVHPPDHNEIERYSLAASEMAKKIDNPVLQSAALGAQFFIYFSQSNHRQWLEICKQRMEFSQRANFNDAPEMTDILHRMSHALATVGEFNQALDYIAQTQNYTEQTGDVFKRLQSMLLESHVCFLLDCWDEVVNVDERWRALKQRYPNFMKRAGPQCFQIGVAASVFMLRGDKDKGVALREESFAIMSAWEPLEKWGRGNYY